MNYKDKTVFVGPTAAGVEWPEDCHFSLEHLHFWQRSFYGGSDYGSSEEEVLPLFTPQLNFSEIS
jgi:hypothetical protein